MKKISDLMALVAKLIEQFIKNPEAVYNRFEMFVNEQWEDLQENVKIIFFGPFVDKGMIVTPEPTTTVHITELLQELTKELKARNIPAYYENGRYYHEHVIKWFPNAKVYNTAKPSKIVFLPEGGMTEGKMIENAKKLKAGYKDYLSNYLQKVITMVKAGYYDEPESYMLAFLEEVRESDNVQCKLWADRGSDGEFYLFVN